MKARNTIDEMLAVIQAHKDGNQIQYWYSQYGNFAENGTWENCAGSPEFNFGGCIYRVKPTPKKVPLTQEDIPLDRLVWLKRGVTGSVQLIVLVAPSGICVHNDFFSFDVMGNSMFTISFDGGKTWQKCEKEVVE